MALDLCPGSLSGSARSALASWSACTPSGRTESGSTTRHSCPIRRARTSLGLPGTSPPPRPSALFASTAGPRAARPTSSSGRPTSTSRGSRWGVRSTCRSSAAWPLNWTSRGTSTMSCSRTSRTAHCPSWGWRHSTGMWTSGAAGRYFRPPAVRHRRTAARRRSSPWMRPTCTPPRSSRASTARFGGT